MNQIKRCVILVALILTYTSIGSSEVAFLNSSQTYHRSFMTWPSLSLRYSYTDSVGGSLSFQNGKAFCSGFISPLDDSFVKITVTLYKKSGNQWLFVKSWSGNSSGGMTASAGGSVAVDHGTYKLVTTGNVGNLEYPSYSTQKTY